MMLYTTEPLSPASLSTAVTVRTTVPSGVVSGTLTNVGFSNLGVLSFTSTTFMFILVVKIMQN